MLFRSDTADHRWCGFVHAGGVLQDATIKNMTHSQSRAVFAPKIEGWHKVRMQLQAVPVEAVVMFSSIASFLGGPGQANYTAANAALDATAAIQQAQGSAGSSVQWGTWSGGGMALRDPSTMQRAEKVGIGVVMPEVGLSVMSAFMAATAAGGASVEMLQVGVASPFVWSTALSKISNPGIFNEYEVAKPTKSKESSKKRGGKPADRKSVV